MMTKVHQMDRWMFFLLFYELCLVCLTNINGEAKKSQYIIRSLRGSFRICVSFKTVPHKKMSFGQHID
jgi:hypothetical protein